MRTMIACLVAMGLAGCGSGDAEKAGETVAPRPVSVAKPRADQCGIPFIRRVALSVCQMSVANGNNINSAINSTDAAYRSSECSTGEREKGLKVGEEMAQDVMAYDATCDAALLGRNPEIGSAN